MSARPLAADRLEDNVVVCGSRQTVWYSVPAVRWHWQSETARVGMLESTGLRYAQLLGRRVFVRWSETDFDVGRWAEQLAASAIDPPPGWREHIAGVEGYLDGEKLTEKRVCLGIETGRSAARWLGLPGRRLTARQQQKVLADLDRIVAGPGINGRPLSATELEELFRRSLALGFPPPRRRRLISASREKEDMIELTDPVEWSAEPYGRAVRLVVDVDRGGRP